MVHEHGPEVILPDPMLPDRSGDELYAGLQRDPATWPSRCCSCPVTCPR
jgi:hypothetical protein